MKTTKPFYTVPNCEIDTDVSEDILCVSPDGVTENFDNLDDFTW